MFSDLLLPAALGGLGTLGFAPWNFYPLTVIALVGLIGLWRAAGPARAAWRGFVFGAAHFAVGVYWAFMVLHDHADAGTLLAGLGTVALIVYLACYTALVGALAGLTRWLSPALWALVVVPAAWGLAELLCSWGGCGFPWLVLGYVTIAAPLNGLAAIVGVHGLSVAVVMAAGTLWLLYAGTLTARLIALVLVAALPYIVYLVPAPAYWTRPLSKTLSVAVLPGRDALAPDDTLRRYRDMTRRADADLVVWPGWAMPGPTASILPGLELLNDALIERGQTVLAGVRRSAAQVGHPGSRILVLGVGRMDSGLPRRLNAGGAERDARGERGPIRSHGVALGVSTGFEDASGGAMRRRLPVSGLLVDITDDARFAGTTAPAQHLEMARMRALETGRPLIRAANAGANAVIDFDGRLRHVVPAGERARLVANLKPRAGATPYAAYGDRPLWWASVAVTLLALLGSVGRSWMAARRRRSEERGTSRGR